MATITGTSTTDVLIGTSGDDILRPLGVGGNEAPDFISGGDGADVYDLSRSGTNINNYVIDDNGLDGGSDSIIGPGALVQTASLGYQGFATALRDGDDLILVTPGRPSRFRKPGFPSYEIKIIDHYSGEAIETIEAGGVLYNLPTGLVGTVANDIMAGTILDDIHRARGGNDYMTGNEGHDTLSAGTGDDFLFGDSGNDTLRGQAGNDRIYGGTGNDVAKGGSGFDWIYLQDGNDRGLGGADNDYIYGQDGNDRLLGGGGQDMLSGGRGDDTMIGGNGGDTYRYGYDVDALGSMDLAGHDVINDKGDKAAWNNFDSIELFGYYGPSDGSSGEAYDRLEFEKVGLDMVMTSDGGTGSITVKNQFGANKFAIEELHFNAAYWTPLRFKILDGAKTDIGDDRRYSNGQGGEWNEIIFGTDSADQVFGDSGTNFIWLGAGADTLIYKESDPENWYGSGGSAVNDKVQDFDVTMDLMDFTEINSVGSIANLTISDNAAGNATVTWLSGDFEVSNIFIELRGVTAAELTTDHFVFV